MNISFVLCTKSSIRTPPINSIHMIGKMMKSGDELIVIENTINIARYSQKYIRDYVPAACRAVYISITRGTLGYSRNIAFQKVKGDILIFVDDDVVIHSGLRTSAHSFFLRHPTAAVYVNPFRPFADNPWSIISCAYWNQALIFKRKLCKIRVYPLACSAFQMNFIKKHAIRCNETIFTGEDMDLLLTIYERGGAMYFDPSIFHVHYFATSASSFIKKHFLYGKNFKDLQILHPETYMFVDNIYNYISTKKYILPLKYLGSVRRIIARTIEFLAVSRLSFRYIPHVLTLMTALATGVYASIPKRQ